MKKITMCGDKIWLTGIDKKTNEKHLVIYERKTKGKPFEHIDNIENELGKPILDIKFTADRSILNLIETLEAFKL